MALAPYMLEKVNLAQATDFRPFALKGKEITSIMTGIRLTLLSLVLVVANTALVRGQFSAALAIPNEEYKAKGVVTMFHTGKSRNKFNLFKQFKRRVEVGFFNKDRIRYRSKGPCFYNGSDVYNKGLLVERLWLSFYPKDSITSQAHLYWRGDSICLLRSRISPDTTENCLAVYHITEQSDTSFTVELISRSVDSCLVCPQEERYYFAQYSKGDSIYQMEVWMDSTRWDTTLRVMDKRKETLIYYRTGGSIPEDSIGFYRSADTTYFNKKGTRGIYDDGAKKRVVKVRDHRTKYGWGFRQFFITKRQPNGLLKGDRFRSTFIRRKTRFYFALRPQDN